MISSFSFFVHWVEENTFARIDGLQWIHDALCIYWGCLHVRKIFIQFRAEMIEMLSKFKPALIQQLCTRWHFNKSKNKLLTDTFVTFFKRPFPYFFFQERTSDACDALVQWAQRTASLGQNPRLAIVANQFVSPMRYIHLWKEVVSS